MTVGGIGVSGCSGSSSCSGGSGGSRIGSGGVDNSVDFHVDSKSLC